MSHILRKLLSIKSENFKLFNFELYIINKILLKLNKNLSFVILNFINN